MCEVLDKADVWSESTPVGRREYICGTCREPIVMGVRHLRVAYLADGRWWTVRAHLPCADLTQEIQYDHCGQDGWTPEPGMSLREQVREHMRDVPGLLVAYRDVLRRNLRDERAVDVIKELKRKNSTFVLEFLAEAVK